MELMHLESVQEFTSDGECSKIKVSSYTVTWGSVTTVNIYYIISLYCVPLKKKKKKFLAKLENQLGSVLFEHLPYVVVQYRTNCISKMP